MTYIFRSLEDDIYILSSSSLTIARQYLEDKNIKATLLGTVSNGEILKISSYSLSFREIL